MDAKCLDCDLLYKDFFMDTVLPNDLWLKIHPEGFNGLICVNCIQKRLRKIKETAMFCVSEVDFKLLKELKNSN